MSNLLRYGTSILYPETANSKPYYYNQTVAPVGQIVTLDTLKQHLNITTSDDDALLSIYLDTATNYAESFTRRDYLVRTYETLRDYWDYSNKYGFDRQDTENFLITKSPVNSIVSIEYLVDGVFTTLDSSIYYFLKSNDFSRILLVDGKTYPTDKDDRMQSIKIKFTAGTETPPNSIINAIMNIVGALYADRGDCNCDFDTVSRYVSGAARAILLQNRIERF